jgi:NADPH-dependent curcumin reductase CurA
MARVWHLVRRPDGLPRPDDFALQDVALPPLEEGMVRVRNLWLSIDPYLRGMMTSAPMELSGRAVGQVIESRAPGIHPGALVRHGLGWRDEAVLAGTDVQLLWDEELAPTAYLGALGNSGMTAYFALLNVAEAKGGDRVFVSSAAGAVGSLVVQIARHRGLSVVASAGGAEKCRWLKTLGADAVVDHRAPGELVNRLRLAAPDGIDVYIDNVGGDHLNAAIAVSRPQARIVLVGMISTYNGSEPNLQIRQPMQLVSKAITLRGFRVGDFMHRRKEFETEMAAMIKSGAVIETHTLYDGLSEAVPAFLGLFTGLSLGKPIVRL